jgi:hypothetical protein
MKKLLLSIIAVVSLCSAHAQQWVSASTIGAVQSGDIPTYTAKDGNGNLYLASNFSGTKTFGSGPQTASGLYDVYLTKYDANGAFVWFRKFGAASAFLQAGGISTDPAGNIYLAGSFTNQIVINGAGVLSNGGRDIFLFKIDPAGTTLWGKTAGGQFADEPFSISVSGSKVFLCGLYNLAFTDGAVSIAAPTGSEDAFIASYSTANGACTGMIRCGGTTTDFANSISASSNGIYVTGSFVGASTFGSFNLTSANTSGPNPSPTPDMFLIKCDSALNVIWAVKAGAGSNDQGNGVSQDAQGNAYVAGYFYRTVNFGNGVTLIEANGYGDGFVVKYSASGLCQWGHKISSGVSDVAAAISTDPQGSCYVTGAFGASATITGSNSSNATVFTSGASDAFIAKWATNGVLRWTTTAGSSTDDRGQSIVWDVNGYCQFVVNHSGTITAGSLGTYSAPGGGLYGQLVGSFNGLTAGLNAVNNSVSINLYPNPVNNGLVTIVAPENASVRYVAVYSLDGKLVFENSFLGGNEVQINTEQFVKGQYIVSIQTTEGSASSKFTVN